MEHNQEMRRQTPHLILIAVVGLAAVLLAKPAAACSCTRLESPGDDFLLTANTINIPDPRACAEVSLMIGTRKK
jgi:hypothetical protein